MTTFRFLLAAALLAAPVAIHAQRGAATVLAPGATVRLRLARPVDPWLEGHRARGELVALTADSIVIARDGAREAFPRAAVGRVDLHLGRRSRGGAVLRGAGAGLFAGAAIGVLVGAASSRPDDFFGQDFPVVIGGALFGIVGTVAGTIHGANRSLDRWQPVRLPDARVALSARGLGVAVTL